MDSPGTLFAKPSNHHLIPVAITVISLLLIIIIGIYSALSYQKNPSESPEQMAPEQTNKEYSFPRITVDSWKIEKSAAMNPSAPAAAIYPLDTQYGKSEFNSLLFHFFAATSVKETDKSMRAYSNRNGSSLLYMQKDTGSFLYKSTTGIPFAPSSTILDEPKKIVSFAQNALRDDTLAQFATYEKKSNPGVTYYELHRDWNRLGFPILNLLGTLNIKGTSLHDLMLNQSTNPVESDGDIIKTTDNADGKKRPNDFNTVTVGVKNGKIVDVISNLRLFPSISTRAANTKLISYDKAVKKLTANQYSRLYTSPAGEGAVDREKMYPQNKASLSEAVVTESTIAYLEELPGAQQDALAPYYLFRGTGTLSSGYRVIFVATVPATDRKVLGIAAYGFDSTQKQGTFEMGSESAPEESTDPTDQLTVQHQAPALPLIAEICKEAPQSVNDLYNVQIDDASETTFGQYDLQWYFIANNNRDVNQLNFIIDRAKNKLTDITVRDFNSLLNDWESATDVSCPVRLTGRSPSVFIYSNVKRTVTVSLPHTLTYNDPRAVNDTWNITTPTDYLYYEYAPVVLSKPTNGWTMKKSALDQFATTVSSRLALTQPEEVRLKYELQNAAHDISSQNLFIGLINRAELDEKVPVHISPVPETFHRIHFYLSAASPGSPDAPMLNSLTRTSYTVVELGATSN